MAADAEPLEILLHLPLLCEDKVITFSLFSAVCFTLIWLIFINIILQIEVHKRNAYAEFDS